MKRMIIYFISALILFSLISCKKKECHGLVHKNPPALSDTGYNTCEAIYYNFYTYAGDGEGHDLVCQMAYSPIKLMGIFTFTEDPIVIITLYAMNRCFLIMNTLKMNTLK